MYRSGMVRNLDSWLIADLADTAHKEASGACHDKELKKSKQLAEALIHRARREAIQHRDFFREHDMDSCLSRYVRYYEVTLQYLAKMEQIMKCTRKGTV